MSDKLSERIRRGDFDTDLDVRHEAVVRAVLTRIEEEIEVVECQRDVLVKALRPFALEADEWEPDDGNSNMIAHGSNFTVGQLRAARAAIKSVEESK